MSPARDRDLMIEEATSAWRPRTPDGSLLPHPAWADLSEADRQRAFDETVVTRRLERALDPEGRSSTVRAVLARLAG